MKFVHPGTCHAKGTRFLTCFDCILHAAPSLGIFDKMFPQSVISCTPVIYHSNNFGLCSRRCSRIYKSEKRLLWSHNKWNFHFILCLQWLLCVVFWSVQGVKGKKCHGILWEHLLRLDLAGNDSLIEYQLCVQPCCCGMHHRRVEETPEESPGVTLRDVLFPTSVRKVQRVNVF